MPDFVTKVLFCSFLFLLPSLLLLSLIAVAIANLRRLRGRITSPIIPRSDEDEEEEGEGGPEERDGKVFPEGQIIASSSLAVVTG